MYYEDLSRFTYFQDRGPAVVNVGWLEAPHPFPQGKVSREDVAALERLLVQGWQPAKSRGWHDCSLCGRGPEAGPLQRQLDGQMRLLGADILYVPDGDRLYAAPSLIIHYIEDHRYEPPEAFLAALRRTDPTSPDYRRECERIWAAGAAP